MTGFGHLRLPAAPVSHETRPLERRRSASNRQLSAGWRPAGCGRRAGDGATVPADPGDGVAPSTGVWKDAPLPICIKLIEKLVFTFHESSPRGVSRPMTKIDIHQHLWTEPLVAALAGRQRASVRSSRAWPDGPVSCRRASLRDRSVTRGAGAPRRAGRARRTRPRAALPIEPPRHRVPSARAGPAPARRLSRGSARAGRSVRRVGGDRPRPPRSRRCRPRTRRADASGCRCPRAPSAASIGISRLRDVLARLELHGAPLLVHPGPGRATGRLWNPRGRVARRPAVVARADPIRR